MRLYCTHGCCIGGRTGLVPQMALKFGVRLASMIAEVPQIAEFAPGKTAPPQIAEVLTGVARRTIALFAVLFMVSSTIGLISDEIMFFMRFTFLLLAPIAPRG